MTRYQRRHPSPVPLFVQRLALAALLVILCFMLPALFIFTVTWR